MSANGTGRVEVFYNEQWGTICNRVWDIRDAKVVCRQLGYQDAVRTLRNNQVPSGSGRIWLAYVGCTGKEQNITSCSRGAWGKNNCRHSEDAGVECSVEGKTKKKLPSTRLKTIMIKFLPYRYKQD